MLPAASTLSEIPSCICCSAGGTTVGGYRPPLSSRREMLALFDADKSHVLDLIKEAQRFFEESAQDATAAEEAATRSIEDISDRHRRKTLRAIAARAERLALRVTEQQRNKRAENLQVASTITSSIVTDMVNR